MLLANPPSGVNITENDFLFLYTLTKPLSPGIVRDQLLVKQILQSGDRQAYSQLLNIYFDKIYLSMVKMSGDPNEAEDLAMEAFHKAFNKLESYTGEYAFGTWLLKIAKNNCIDHLRRDKKENTNTRFDIEQLNEPCFCEAPHPEQALINQQETHRLHEVINTLHPRYKEIIDCYYFQELSCAEIAKKLQIPENTVKIRLVRARDLLFKLLHNYQAV